MTFIASPSLDFFLTSDSRADVKVRFKIDETVDTVAAGETWNRAITMLLHSFE